MNHQLHKAQIIILNTLRHNKSARFCDLMRLANMQGDCFKFHLRKLCTLGYVKKTEAQDYNLTAIGKEFANNLNEAQQTIQRQPKLAILLIISKNRAGQTLFLVQKRKRNPYFGYYSCIGGPIQWGEDAESTAQNELKKQTGLSAKCAVCGFLRKKDYNIANNELLEDKLFVVLKGSELSGDLSNSWHGGDNKWMTLDEFKKQPKHFASMIDAIELTQTSKMYTTCNAQYDLSNY